MNNYDFVKVDPRVIQMLGGDETDILKEGLDNGDLSLEQLNQITEQASPNTTYDDFPPTTPSATVGANVEILTQILNELKEIKTILAGK